MGKEEQFLYSVFFLFFVPLNHTNTHKHTALLAAGKHKLWIGLVLDPEHGWQWSDGKPFRYLRWSAGKTSLQKKGLKCSAGVPLSNDPITLELYRRLLTSTKKNVKQIPGVSLLNFTLSERVVIHLKILKQLYLIFSHLCVRGHS